MGLLTRRLGDSKSNSDDHNCVKFYISLWISCGKTEPSAVCLNGFSVVAKSNGNDLVDDLDLETVSSSGE
jgi:hypothetical protein